MTVCGYGFSEPEKDICGDDVPAGWQYCIVHTCELKAAESNQVVCSRCGSFVKELHWDMCSFCNMDELLQLTKHRDEFLDEEPF